MKARVWFWLWAFVSLSAGCTATVDVDKTKLGPRPVACMPGTTITCTCPGGGISSQTCTVYGRYDPCVCPSNNAAGTGG